jgi:hypothetical protein
LDEAITRIKYEETREIVRRARQALTGAAPAGEGSE